MTPYINDFFRRSNPEYRETYERGFNAGKSRSEQILKEALKEIRELEAYVTLTATVSLSGKES